MPTYEFRCQPCQIHWLRQFKMSEKPSTITCPECGGICKTVVQAVPAIFKTGGFPGNDMKDLHTGSSAATRGRKPTHDELSFVEREYPDANQSSKDKVEKIIDEAKSGSKRDAVYAAHKRAR